MRVKLVIKSVGIHMPMGISQEGLEVSNDRSLPKGSVDLDSAEAFYSQIAALEDNCTANGYSTGVNDQLASLRFKGRERKMWPEGRTTCEP